MPDPKKVFVIHGRNEAARKAMFTFLRAIGLEPIEWMEAVGATGQSNPFIGQILDSAFAQSQAIIALFTGDDLARLGTRYGAEPLTPQARANVIFEAGMAVGRFPNQTILVTLGSTRCFSDIAGRHVVEIDDSVAKRQALAIRLRDVGCAVQVDTQIDWQTEGHFEQSVQNPDKPNSRELRLFSKPRTILATVALVLMAALLFVLVSRVPQPIVGPNTNRERIIVSGRITRRTAPHDGIMIGIIPAGALAITNSDGSYTISLPAADAPGSYTAVAYDHGQRPYIAGIPITKDQGKFDYVLEGQ
jgi:hypothetical protein